MKFAVDTAHRDFFKNQLKIEFADFFTSEEKFKWKQEVRHALNTRVNEKAPSQELYMAGRDLWRESGALRKLITQSKLADIAADLTEDKGVRLGYDQYLPPLPPHLDKLTPEEPYIQLLKQEVTLESISPIQGILCGVLINLKEAVNSVIYLHSKATLDFSLAEDSLLIVYAKARSFYVLQENDPHAHALKHLGYGFGDMLTDKLNPTIKRY